MVDSALRDLQRRWISTGSPQVGAEFLRTCVQAGKLRPAHLDLAAYCGEEAAQLASGVRARKEPRDREELKAWIQGMAAFDRATIRLSSIYALEEEVLALPRWGHLPGDPQPFDLSLIVTTFERARTGEGLHATRAILGEEMEFLGKYVHVGDPELPSWVKVGRAVHWLAAACVLTDDPDETEEATRMFLAIARGLETNLFTVTIVANRIGRAIRSWALASTAA